MSDRKLLLLLCLLFFGCQQEEECSQDFLSNYNNVKNSFEFLISRPSESAAINLRSSLNNFLSQHEGVSCKKNDDTLSPTSEMKAMQGEINLQRYSSNRAEVVAKLIYGDDDRVDLENSTNVNYREWGRSTVAQISKIKIDDDGTINARTLKQSKFLCDGERFSTQLTAARCSGFLVGPDIVVTAGHCVEDQYDCDENYWVVDYTKDKTKISSQSIYNCSEIIEQVLDYSTGLDYAVLRLDRSVLDRKYFRWRASPNSLRIGDPLVVIGYPSGLPTKVADGAEVKDLSEEEFFRANLDTFAGSSGSAVINSLSGVVEGILVRGETDYVAVDGPDGKRCMVVNQCSDISGCDGNFEEVSRMSSVRGIPLGYSEETLVDGIINKSISSLTSIYGIKLYGKQFAEYEIVGRSFLGSCAIKLVSDKKEENEISIYNCNQNNEILNLIGSYFNKFYY